MDKILSPHQQAVIPYIIIEILKTQGRTVINLGGNVARGDPKQIDHASLPVWHAKKCINDAIAETLRLPPSLWGPRRATNNFPIHTRRALANLVKQGIVAAWNPNNASLFRLVEHVNLPTPTSQLATRPYVRANLDVGTLFMTIVSQSSKDNTYKFVLGKILLDYCKRNSPDAGKHTVPYDYLAGEFTKHYWHQKYRFKMRQHTHRNKGPVAVQILERVFGEDPPHEFGDLDQSKLKCAKQMMLERVFASARTYKGNVVHRFQRIGRGDNMEQRDDIYDYDDVKQTITLKPDAHAFLRQNYAWLQGALVAEWASYLEHANPGLPLMTAKLSHIDSDPPPVDKSKSVFLSATKSPYCFYCESGLDFSHARMNRFLPWQYLFDDHIWNLVITCSRCNNAKRNSVASDKFVDLLIERNSRYLQNIPAMRESLSQLSLVGAWKTMIRGHYGLCVGYGFSKWEA